uniref:Uncharacterized protein n=1 Tax=Glossina austeni TaxID=7395 RepID=A0A1A9VL74_GLOAU
MYSTLQALPEYNGFCVSFRFIYHLSETNPPVFVHNPFTTFTIPINPSNISALVRKISFSGNSNGGVPLPLPGNSIVYAIGTRFTEKAQSLLPPENISKTILHTHHISTVSTVVSSMIPPIQSVSKSIGYNNKHLRSHLKLKLRFKSTPTQSASVAGLLVLRHNRSYIQ